MPLPGNPLWKQIFGYTGHATGQPSFTVTPYLGEGGNQANLGDWTYKTPNYDEGGHASGGGWNVDIPEQFKGIVSPSLREGVGANEGNVGTTEVNWNIDYEKLPNKGMTQYGRLDSVASAEGQQLINPNLVSVDPVYGQITPGWNVKTDTTSFAARLGQIVPAVAMSFLTGFMGPGGASSMIGKGAVGGARSVGGMTGSGVSAGSADNSADLQILRMLMGNRRG